MAKKSRDGNEIIPASEFGIRTNLKKEQVTWFLRVNKHLKIKVPGIREVYVDYTGFEKLKTA